MKPISKTFKIVLGMVLFLVAVRIALPYILERSINIVLKDKVDGYTGRISDVDLSLYRGAFQIEDLHFEKLQNKVPLPFVKAKEIDFSIAWRPLFRGKLFGKIALDQLQVNFVQGPTDQESQTGAEGNWQQALKDLLPIKIEEFKMVNSNIHFRNYHTEPKVDVYLYDVYLMATNLRNTSASTEKLVSAFDFDSKIKKQGSLKIKGRMNLMRDPPSFDLNVAAREIDLTHFNDFFRAYGKFDVKKGRLDLFSEMASENSKMKGYVKPLFTDMDVLESREKQTLLKQGIPEVGVSLYNLLIRRYSKDQVGAKIPIEGDFSNPKIKAWDTVKSTFSHAFGKALSPQVEGKINIQSVRNDQKDKDDNSPGRLRAR